MCILYYIIYRIEFGEFLFFSNYISICLFLFLTIFYSQILCLEKMCLFMTAYEQLIYLLKCVFSLKENSFNDLM